MDNNNNKISKILDESTRKIKFNIDQKKEIEILEETLKSKEKEINIFFKSILK